MNEKQKKSVGKFLSLILRHSPETINLDLDANGWANVDELLLKMAQHQRPVSRQELNNIVLTNDKQRYIFNTDNTRIRANQGHSIEVELNLANHEPPDILYHGTVGRLLPGIQTEGLKRMDRLHVHLSRDIETAQKVGNRRGEAVILRVYSGDMYKDGYLFYLSENGVWLTNDVPAKYLDFKTTWQ